MCGRSGVRTSRSSRRRLFRCEAGPAARHHEMRRHRLILCGAMRGCTGNRGLHAPVRRLPPRITRGARRCGHDRQFAGRAGGARSAGWRTIHRPACTGGEPGQPLTISGVVVPRTAARSAAPRSTYQTDHEGARRRSRPATTGTRASSSSDRTRAARGRSRRSSRARIPTAASRPTFISKHALGASKIFEIVFEGDSFVTSAMR